MCVGGDTRRLPRSDDPGCRCVESRNDDERFFHLLLGRSLRQLLEANTPLEIDCEDGGFYCHYQRQLAMAGAWIQPIVVCSCQTSGRYSDCVAVEGNPLAGREQPIRLVNHVCIWCVVCFMLTTVALTPMPGESPRLLDEDRH